MNHDYIEPIHVLSNLLTETGIKHWIDFGTLLGAVRSGSPIESDHDFDIDVIATGFAQLWAMRQEIRERVGIIIRESDNERILRGFPEHDSLDLQSDRLAIRSCVERSIPHVDFYSCDIRGRDVIHAEELFHFKSFFIDRLARISVLGFQFPCPVLKERLLEQRYGDCWRTPLDYWAYREVQTKVLKPFESPIRCVALAGRSKVREGRPHSELERLRTLFDDVVVVYPSESRLDARCFTEASVSKGRRRAAVRSVGRIWSMPAYEANRVDLALLLELEAYCVADLRHLSERNEAFFNPIGRLAELVYL